LIRTAHGLGILEFHRESETGCFTCTAGRNTRFALLTPGTRQSRFAATPAITTVTPISRRARRRRFRRRASADSDRRSPTTAMQHGTASDGNVYTVGGRKRARGTSVLITEGTIGFWHKFYNGPKGGLRWGIQIRTSRRADGPGTVAYRLALQVFHPKRLTIWCGRRSATTYRRHRGKLQVKKGSSSERPFLLAI